MSNDQDREDERAEAIADTAVDMLRLAQRLPGVDAGESLKLVLCEWMTLFKGAVDPDVWMGELREILLHRGAMPDAPKLDPNYEGNKPKDLAVVFGARRLSNSWLNQADGQNGQVVYAALATALVTFWELHEEQFKLAEFVGSVRRMHQDILDKATKDGSPPEVH